MGSVLCYSHGEKRGLRSDGQKSKRGRTEKRADTDECRQADSYGRERGSRERVGMFRENWIGKQQREGRGSQEEIARVEWRENEREMRESREIGEKQRKVVEGELFLLVVYCILKAAFIRPHIHRLGLETSLHTHTYAHTHHVKKHPLTVITSLPIGITQNPHKAFCCYRGAA